MNSDVVQSGLHGACRVAVPPHRVSQDDSWPFVTACLVYQCADRCRRESLAAVLGTVGGKYRNRVSDALDKSGDDGSVVQLQRTG